MFQFPAFAPDLFRCAGFTCTGCPIRIFTDHFMLADPRDFSQLAASFFASRSLGILRSLFLSFLLWIWWNSTCASSRQQHILSILFFQCPWNFHPKKHLNSFCLWNCSPQSITIKRLRLDFLITNWIFFFTFSYLFISLNIVNELAEFTEFRHRIIY